MKRFSTRISTWAGKVKSVIGVRGFLAWIKDAFDIRDFLVIGGLSMLGYGIYIISPPIAFIVCGSIIFLIGIVTWIMPGIWARRING